MKIKYKKNGNFEIEFTDYFKTIDDLKEFIKKNNKFVNVENIELKIINVYNELANLDVSIKSSILGWTVIKQFKFKYVRPNNINFWLERGYGIDEFNQYNNSLINELCDINNNKFKFNNFKFEMIGIPKCKLCGSNLKIEPSIGRYNIICCLNSECDTNKHKEIESISHLSFLPIDMFLNKNKRINITSKINKEYWLLNGYTYLDSINKVKEIKNNLKLVNVNSFEYYKTTTDKTDDEIRKTIKEMSSLCVEYWLEKDITLEEAKNKISNLQKINSNKIIKKRKENPEQYSATTQTQIGYWLNKGFSEEESKIKLSERQTTFSLEKCIQKYGETNGLKRFNERQKKWLLNNKRNNFSKISQDLFWDILESDKSISDNEIYFATYNNGEKNNSGKNHEYRLDVIESYILPDFFDKTTGRIIEFDGTYYHRLTPENSLREEKRDKMIIKSGYEVLHISELDYKNNKQEIIDKCVAFLNKK
jgi:hypothetical protein